MINWSKYVQAMIAILYMILFWIASQKNQKLIKCHPKIMTRNCAKQIAEDTNLAAIYMAIGIILPVSLYVWSVKSKSNIVTSTAMTIHAIFGAVFSIYSFIWHKLISEDRYKDVVDFNKYAPKFGMFASIVLLGYVLIN